MATFDGPSTLRRLVCVALVLGGCAALEPVAPLETPEPIPRQLQDRQVIVTLAPASPAEWARMRGVLARVHGLREVGAFPLDSLGVQCVVFEIPLDRSIPDVLAR